MIRSMRLSTERSNQAALAQAVKASSDGDESGWAELCGALVWAGFLAPEGLSEVYDTI